MPLRENMRVSSAPNQGSPEERLRAFEDAVKTVYASTMNEDALQYRVSRGLAQKDEQMAVLVQRVSGDYFGDYSFPIWPAWGIPQTFMYGIRIST